MCIAYIRKHSFPINTKQRSISINSVDAELKNIITRNDTSETFQKKKKVMFSEDPPQVICTLTPSSTQTLEEKASSHWQPDDYERFKGTARIIATEIFKSSLSQPENPHSYDAVLTKVLQFCASSSELEEESAIDSSPVPPELFFSLAHWVRAGNSRRGLEKFSIPHHMQCRPQERLESIRAVIMTQNLLKEVRRLNNSNHREFSLGGHKFSLVLPDDEILRMVSKRFSNGNVRYATAMGHADAVAVGKYPKHFMNLEYTC
jgi:hypothetical protein